MESSITVSKSGSYSLPSIVDTENRQVFLGAENSITLSRFYNIRFLCNYQMQWYGLF